MTLKLKVVKENTRDRVKIWDDEEDFGPHTRRKHSCQGCKPADSFKSKEEMVKWMREQTEEKHGRIPEAQLKESVVELLNTNTTLRERLPDGNGWSKIRNIGE